MRATAILRSAGLVFALAGCFGEDDDYEDSRARGDLGAGEFVYGCFNETDIASVEGDCRLPLAIAVGGRFDLRFSIKSGAQPTVIAPASDFVRTIDGGFQVRGPGQFALLAVNGNREVVDIKHLRGAEIDEVRVQEDAELPTALLRMDQRQSMRLLAVPYDSRRVKLGGALNYAWSSSDESLISIESLAELNRVRVRAGNKSGKGTLRIDVAGKSFTVQVEVGSEEVEPEPMDAGAAIDAEAADATTDADSDAQSDANDVSSDADTDAQTEGGTP